MRRILFVLACSIAACSPSAEQAPANNADQLTQTAEPEKAAVPSLEGEWVIDQLNGKAPDQVWPMTVEVTADRFTIVSECRRMIWSMSQQGNIVKFTPAPGGECGRVRSPAEHVADKAMKLANIAMFSDDGRTVQLTGPGGSVAMSRR